MQSYAPQAEADLVVSGENDADPVDLTTLRAEIENLIQTVRREADVIAASWPAVQDQREFAPSAANLRHYLALRHHDLRNLQRRLMTVGLSSLGRLESRVIPTLEAVEASLAVLCGLPARPYLPEAAFFAGERLLTAHTCEVLGPPTSLRSTALLVTCPSSAADDPEFIRCLAMSGVEALRINCAHDDAVAWDRMIRFARAAAVETGRELRVLMDLAGPKIRTGAVRRPSGDKQLRTDVLLALVPPGGLAALPDDAPAFAVECQLPEALRMVRQGDAILFDDAKVRLEVEMVAPWGVVARVRHARAGGVKLREEKGLSFPDTELIVPPLTAKDLADLDFVARHADGISYSFVQSADDVALLQAELARRRSDDWQRLSVVLKVETLRSLRNLPAMVVQAASRQPTAIMIARGDLASEIGFARTAEIQEEILWIGEAAHVPVIWATQVLESMIKHGTPVRGEMTDAAMAARAECVMLNKGPYLLEAIPELNGLLARMADHQHKKTPRLRRLMSF